MDQTGQNLLEMRGITKEFPGLYALKDVNLSVKQGEIHALVGENGAGKSTLMNVLSGVYPFGSYTGETHYRGELCKFHTIKQSEEKGIVIIHQELALVPYLSIAENVFLGNERGSYFNIDWDAANAESRVFLRRVGLSESPETLIKDIGVGKQQLVEIAKALAKKVGLLILDEPTASLNETDSQQLLELLLELRKGGVTSIIISHKLNEISYVADRITVIRDGMVIKTLDKSTDSFNEADIIHAMVGRDLSDRFPKRAPKTGGVPSIPQDAVDFKNRAAAADNIALEVRNWNVDHPLYEGRKVCDNVNIKVRKGEVVGISGLMGAGRTELAMSVFGKSYGANIQGQIFINGKEVHLNSVQEAIEHRFAYVTEDRKGNGLVLSKPISENTTLAKMDKVSRRGIIDADAEVQVAEKYRQDLRTKSTSVTQLVGNLSGGNQQKVLLAKWMFADPEVLILDEPTRGIDVGAKYDIYVLINDLIAQGKSVIMISSELPEVLGMCDRIYVMNEGRIVAEMPAEEATQHSIMAAILQSEKKE